MGDFTIRGRNGSTPRRRGDLIARFLAGLSLLFFTPVLLVSGEAVESPADDPLLVRVSQATGLRRAYVKEAVEALGPIQRAALSRQPMLESFLRDLAGLRLLAERALAESKAGDTASEDRSSFERDHALVQALIEALP